MHCGATATPAEAQQVAAALLIVARPEDGLELNVRLNAAVRITPPTAICDHWVAENLLLRRRYKLSSQAAAVLVAACKPRERGELATDVGEKDGDQRSAEFWSRMVDGLYRHELIVEDAAPRPSRGARG